MFGLFRIVSRSIGRANVLLSYNRINKLRYFSTFRNVKYAVKPVSIRRSKKLGTSKHAEEEYNVQSVWIVAHRFVKYQMKDI
jgi:hypothetical protein